MAVDNILRTYGDTSIVTDVIDLIENVSPTEDDLLVSLEKTEAISTIHSWQNDTLDTAGSAAVGEGADPTYPSLTTPTRLTNLTEIVAKPFKVSDTQRAVSHYGFQDAFAYNAEKAMKNWRNAAEFDLLRSTLTSGASGTTPKMAGVIAWISTNLTAHASGTIFSESILRGLLRNSYENGNGDSVDTIMVGSFMKARLSGFSGRSGTQYVVPLTQNVVAQTTDKYISDQGTSGVVLHRYVQQSGDSTGRVLGIVKDKFKVAYLKGRTPKMVMLAKTGDSTPGQIIGEMTLECRNEPCNFMSSGFLLSV